MTLYLEGPCDSVKSYSVRTESLSLNISLASIVIKISFHVELHKSKKRYVNTRVGWFEFVVKLCRFGEPSYTQIILLNTSFLCDFTSDWGFYYPMKNFLHNQSIVPFIMSFYETFTCKIFTGFPNHLIQLSSVTSFFVISVFLVLLLGGNKYPNVSP